MSMIKQNLTPEYLKGNITCNILTNIINDAQPIVMLVTLLSKKESTECLLMYSRSTYWSNFLNTWRSEIFI